MPAELGAAGVVLFGSLPDPAAILERAHDREVRVVRGNPALARFLDRSQDELDGIDAREMFQPDPGGVLIARVHRALDEQCEVTYEMIRELPLGRGVHLGTITPVAGNKVIVVARDVSEERGSSERVTELEALTQTGTWSWSLPDGTVTWSAELRRIIGYGSVTPARLEEGFAFVHPDDRDRLRRTLDEVRVTGTSEEVQYRVLRPSGEQRIVCTRASRAVDATGAPTRIHGTMQDITERRALEAGELARQRMVRQQDRAMKLNDDVIQALARAWLALNLERPEEIRLAVTEGMETVRRMMAELLQASGTLDGAAGRGLRPGQLAHLRATRTESNAEPIDRPDDAPSP